MAHQCYNLVSLNAFCANFAVSKRSGVIDFGF